MVQTILLMAILVLAALAMIVAEICTPTFGALAAGALGLLVWACYLAFSLDSALGVGMVVALLLGLPVFVFYAVRILPRTGLGRHLALRQAQARPGGGTPENDWLSQLVGRSAQTETLLRPSGTIRVDGKRIVAQAESGLIDKGQTVRILKACGTYVVVRKEE